MPAAGSRSKVLQKNTRAHPREAMGKEGKNLGEGLG